MSEIDRLEGIARAAPVGPWHAPGLGELHDKDHRVIGAFSDVNPVDQEARPDPSIEEGDKLAAYCVAFSPDRVLALLAVVRAAQAINEGLAHIEFEQGMFADLRNALAELEKL